MHSHGIIELLISNHVPEDHKILIRVKGANLEEHRTELTTGHQKRKRGVRNRQRLLVAGAPGNMRTFSNLPQYSIIFIFENGSK